MEAQSKRKINKSTQYDKYFSKADMLTNTIKKEGADLNDTIPKIKEMIKEYHHQAKKIAFVLKGKDTEQTCKNVWHFVYENIQYKLDKEGTEQLRTPNRTWADRFEGVDCDCYSIFIACILENLGINYKMRLAEYGYKGYYQHIYIVVPIKNKKEIIIDCVKDKFNDEQPYTNKKDIMRLEILSGFGNVGQPNENIKNYLDTLSNNDIQNLIVSVTEYLLNFGDDSDIEDKEDLLEAITDYDLSIDMLQKELAKYNQDVIVSSDKSFAELYAQELTYLNSLKLSKAEITALQIELNRLAESKKQAKYAFNEGIIDESFIEALKEQELWQKEMQIIKPLREKRLLTKEWFSKNAFPIVVGTGTVILLIGTIISFMGSDEPAKESKQDLKGFSNRKKYKSKNKESKKLPKLK